ncbi:MAG: cellulase family glycosylhydrolase [Kiritimatiellaeota bacterium]|nr:cellulase family glycosylhydrolase [Kiritimatiellota bacterium]
MKKIQNIFLVSMLVGAGIARGALPAVSVEGEKLVAGGKELRLRGINWGWWHLSGTRYTEVDMKNQAEWGANMLRLAFSYGDIEKDGKWDEAGFAQLDEVVQWAKKYNQYVILDMHVCPGGQDPAHYCDGGKNLLWKDDEYQKRFIALWVKLAEKYRDEPTVAAYEIMNEPCTQRPEPSALVALSGRCLEAIRKVDAKKVIVLSGDQWGNARDLRDEIKHPDPQVLYTFHFYEGGARVNWLRNAHDVAGESGTRDWTRFEFEIPITGEVRELQILLRSSRNSGKAWFDDIELRDGSGGVVRSFAFDKNSDPFWVERSAGKESGAWDAAVGHNAPGSLRFENSMGEAYNGWISPKIRVWQGQTYKVSGWMKLENATGGSYAAAALWGVNSADIDRADLRRLIQPALDFRAKHGVPLWVGEFAAARNEGPEGYQINQVEARIALFEELGIGWTYWNYRETAHPDGMALHAQKREGGEHPINAALLALLKEAWAAPVGASSTPFVHKNRVRPGVPDGWFPFEMNWDGRGEVEADLPPPVWDVSFLNTKPAGANGRIIVKDGHFAEEKTGKRVRFLGVNGMTFPTREQAEKYAPLLARAGINLVRLHNMDNKGNWGAKQTVFDHSHDDTQHYQADVIDNFHYSVAQLKKQGIYVTFEVQVNRQLKAGDGVGDNPLLGKAMKRHDRYSRVWIERFKEYAREMLCAVNPHTGLALKDDPVLATVEINNENSLYQNAYGVPAPEAVPEPYATDLREQWNAWLRKRHASDAAMLAAWNEGAGLGKSLVNDADAWKTEARESTKIEILETGKNAGPTFKVAASKGATAWHAQAHLLDLTFEDGKTYTISFRAKSTTPRPANIRACHQNPYWENYGLSRDFEIGAEWRDYSFTFNATKPVPAAARITLILGGESATFEIDDFDIREGWPTEKLADGESLKNGNIKSGFGTPARNLDWRRFLADTDRAFAEEIRDFLRDELGVRAPICDTQIDYGRLEGFYREQNMDYTDAHGYWQHPEFPGKPFDFNNWFIRNTPQIDVMGNGKNESMLENLALYRVEGKPYIISEFDHPAPNDYASEMLPVAAAFAAFQDWDGLVLFCFNDNPEKPIIDLWFDITHPAKFGFLPQAALIFRTGVFPSSSRVSVLTLPQDIWLDDSLHASDAWAADRKPNTLTERVAVSDEFTVPNTKPAILNKHTVAQKSGISVQQNPADEKIYFRAASPASAIIAGRISNATSGALALAKVETDGGFIAASAVTMDSKPFATTQRLLLTIANRFENTGMKWNAARTSVGNDWGKAPILAAGISAEVSLQLPDEPWKVYALSAAGQRRAEVPTMYRGGKLEFKITPQQEAIWYEITR